MTKIRSLLPCALLLLWASGARAAIVVSGSTTGLPPSTGFVADCSTWSSSLGDVAWLRFWARNDDDANENPRDVLLVRGATYLIDVEIVEDLPFGGCITVDDSSAGGRTRTRMIDENYEDWANPIPSNNGFYVNGAGPTYTNWRNDDQEGYYDLDGWRLHERLDPGVLYLEDIARWALENYSNLTSLVTVSP